jgi:hypothetical protein
MDIDAGNDEEGESPYMSKPTSARKLNFEKVVVNGMYEKGDRRTSVCVQYRASVLTPSTCDVRDLVAVHKRVKLDASEVPSSSVA